MSGGDGYAPTGKEERRSRKKRGEKRSTDAGDGGGGGGGQTAEQAQAQSMKDTARRQGDLVILGENLSDKLKMLDYDEKFLERYGMVPISRHYFVYPADAASQLRYFGTLVSWLLSFQGADMQAPEEYGDPNEICSQVEAELRKIGKHEDVAKSSMLSGCGADVLAILNTLAQEALRHNAWQWGRPVIPQEEIQREAEDEAISELTLDQHEDEIEDVFGDDDADDAFIDVDTMPLAGRPPEDEEKTQMIEADIDAAAWRVEVERVLPQLVVHIRNHDKDWRTHVEQMKAYETKIAGSMTVTQTHLDKLHQEISKTLEKITAREKHMNKQLEGTINEFRVEHDKLAAKKEQYKAEGSRVSELTRELGDIGDELDSVKQQMDERGNNISDQKPLVNIKQALTRLKKEISEMDLRIGVCQHQLMTAKVGSQAKMVNDMHRDPVDDEDNDGSWY